MMNQFRQFLGNFVRLSDAEFALFEEKAFIKNCSKNEIITRAGEVEQYFYFVLSGVIHHYFLKNKEMVTTELVGKDAIVGSAVSFFTQKPSPYFVQTLQPSVLVGISKTNLEYLYANNRNWQRVGRMLISFFLVKQEQQYIDILRFPIRERLIRFFNQYPELINQVPQTRVASYLKINPETYTRIKHVLNFKTELINTSSLKE